MSIEPPVFVPWIGDDEELAELVNLAKYRYRSNGAEHAALTLEDGRRPMVRGGRDGIRFDIEGDGAYRVIVAEIEERRIRVVRIEWHSRPPPEKVESVPEHIAEGAASDGPVGSARSIAAPSAA